MVILASLTVLKFCFVSALPLNPLTAHSRSYEILLAKICLLNSRLRVYMCVCVSFREKVEKKGGLEMSLEMRPWKKTFSSLMPSAHGSEKST